MDFEFSQEIKKYPFIRITLALICGIALSLITNINSLWFLLLFGIGLITFLVFHLLNKYSQNTITGILISLILVFAGGFISSSQSEHARAGFTKVKEGLIIGEVNNDPKYSEKTTTVEIQILAVKNNDDWISADGKTLLYVENNEKSKNLRPGDKIVFSPQLSEIENKGNPEEFDCKKYLSYNLILSSDYIKSDEWQLLSNDYELGISSRMLRFRMSLISKLKSLGLNNDELAVASALALGYKDSLSDEVRHNYASSGAMHILAVSGLHVGIIYGIILFLLNFFKNEKFKIPKFIITIALIWFYAALTGLSPSVNRAALMFTIIALGKLQKHNAGSLNAIAASAFILLVINPMNLTNLGFQLSYIAVIGIVLLYDSIYHIFEVKNKILDKIWSLTAVSVAAQIATAPLGLFYFHQFSNYFLLTNYLLIPVSTIAIWLIVLIFSFSWIGFVEMLFARLLEWVIKTMNYITSGIESLPFSVTNDVYISFPQLIFLYLAIILFAIFFFNSKKYKHLAFGVSCLILFSSLSLVQTIKAKDQQSFLVYNINKTTAINIIDRRDNIMFANLDSLNKNDISFSAKNNWLKKGLETEKYIDLSSSRESILSNVATINKADVFYKKKFIAFNDLRVFVIDDSFKPLITDENFKKMKVNFLILSNSPYIKLEKILQYFEFEKLIFDSSNKTRSIENWDEENKILRLKIHNVKTDGAFVFTM